jgi:hypothetical protein
MEKILSDAQHARLVDLREANKGARARPSDCKEPVKGARTVGRQRAPVGPPLFASAR